jgi:hypothetical protein
MRAASGRVTSAVPPIRATGFLPVMSDDCVIVLRSGSAVEPRMLSSEIDDRGGRDKRWDARRRCHSLEPFLCETLQRDGNALWRAEVIPAASRRDDDA